MVFGIARLWKYRCFRQLTRGALLGEEGAVTTTLEDVANKKAAAQVWDRAASRW
ncbi:Uncharacterised protein [Mycobacteroides abscessus subsp. bolletii]|nr:Uncharacterised protein [Mycobacteroides abscessus subsp. bolletii]